MAPIMICILKIVFRLVLVVAAYVAAFAVFWRYPLPDRLFALVPGTLLALLLVLIRKDQISGVLLIGLTTFLGSAISFVILEPSTGHNEDTPRYEIGAAMVGAIIGGVVGLVNHERLQRRKKRDGTS